MKTVLARFVLRLVSEQEVPTATLARRLRLGATSMFMLSGLVWTLCGAPALASDIIPVPPPVQFTNNGKIQGTLQILGVTLPITGTMDYLDAGGSQQLYISVDTEQITTDSWVTTTPTVTNEWEIVSTDPTTCQKEVLSGNPYSQCTGWQNPSPNQWSLECTATVLDKQATVLIETTLSGNLLVSLVEKTTINGRAVELLKITVDSQGTFAPDSATFDRPSICSD